MKRGSLQTAAERGRCGYEREALQINELAGY